MLPKLSFLTFLLFIFSCQSPLPKVEIPNEIDQEGLYKNHYYKTLNVLRANSDKPEFRVNEQTYGVYEGFIGNHLNATKVFERIEAERGINYPTIQPEVLTGYQAYDAKEAILKLADSTNLLLINEAHHRSEHRVFTTSLLEKLAQKGYHYLALEGLSTEDSVQVQNYPKYNAGFYIKDPNFGNMVRKALSLGFELISYDEAFDNTRDSVQAANIYNKSFGKDSTAKVIVHAGYGHIGKKTFGDGTFVMGHSLITQYGLKPIVIDQTDFSAPSSIEQGSSYYKYITENYDFTKPIVLKKENYWSGYFFGIYDIAIIHPIPTLKNGRESWKFIDKNQKLYKIPTKIQKRYDGYLVQARLATENNKSIPIDQIELSESKQYLVLPAGKYRFTVRNLLGEVVKEWKDEI